MDNKRVVKSFALSKTDILLVGTVLALLIYMGIYVFRVSGGVYQDRLLVIPQNISSPKTPATVLADWIEKEGLLTYQIEEEMTVKTAGFSQTMAVRGTNYTYPFVTGYSFLAGNYFTQWAQEQNLKHIVFNHAAAAAFFGDIQITGLTVEIGNQKYTVTGVIDNKSEDPTAFMPLGLMNSGTEGIQSILFLLDDAGGLTREYVQNQVKQLGITDQTHYFIPLGELYGHLVNCRVYIVLISGGCVLWIADFYLARLVRKWMRKIKELEKEAYFAQLLKGEPTLFLGFACALGFIGASIYYFGKVGLALLMGIMDMKDWLPLVGRINDNLSDFQIYGELQKEFIFTGALFLINILILAVFVFRCIHKSWLWENKGDQDIYNAGFLDADIR